MTASVKTSTLLMGYGQAHYRFVQEDVEVGDTARGDPQAARAFLPLFEALNWAVALCDRLDRVWPVALSRGTYWHDGFPAGPTMRGVRFARNRVHHQWADALRRRGWADHLTEPEAPIRRDEKGRPLPPPPLPRYALEDPVRVGGLWMWRRELPAGRPDADGEAAYVAALADRAVRGTLDELRALFDSARTELGAWP